MAPEKRTKTNKTSRSKDFTQMTYKDPKFAFKYTQDPSEYDDPSMNYIDLKNALKYIDKIKSVKDKGEIGKTLVLLTEITQKGAARERVGRIRDYANMERDVYKIAEYLSEAKYDNKESLELAKRIKESLLEKISRREGQLEKDDGSAYRLRTESYFKAAAIIGISGGIIFLSPNLTGNVIANFSIKITSFIGIGLLAAGLAASFLWLRIRKK